MDKRTIPDVKKFFRPPDYIQIGIDGIIFHGYVHLKKYCQMERLMLKLMRRWNWPIFYKIVKEAETYKFAHAGNFKEHPGLEIPGIISVKFIRNLLVNR